MELIPKNTVQSQLIEELVLWNRNKIYKLLPNPTKKVNEKTHINAIKKEKGKPGI